MPMFKAKFLQYTKMLNYIYKLLNFQNAKFLDYFDLFYLLSWSEAYENMSQFFKLKYVPILGIGETPFMHI